MSLPVSVRHNTAAHRFESAFDGHLSIAAYEKRDDLVIFSHTHVPPELRGRGLAAEVVRAALEHARAEGWRIVPACSYVAGYIARHPEFKDLIAAD
jgi:predicted GNAT family acetyltransferase